MVISHSAYRKEYTHSALFGDELVRVRARWVTSDECCPFPVTPALGPGPQFLLYTVVHPWLPFLLGRGGHGSHPKVLVPLFPQKGGNFLTLGRQGLRAPSQGPSCGLGEVDPWRTPAKWLSQMQAASRAVTVRESSKGKLGFEPVSGSPNSEGPRPIGVPYNPSRLGWSLTTACVI